MLLKLILALIIVFIFYVLYTQYKNCNEGKGGIADKICHVFV